MLLMETAITIRGWVLENGRSIHVMAHETGISRSTIKTYLQKPKLMALSQRVSPIGDAKMTTAPQDRLYAVDMPV